MRKGFVRGKSFHFGFKLELQKKIKIRNPPISDGIIRLKSFLIFRKIGPQHEQVFFFEF